MTPHLSDVLPHQFYAQDTHRVHQHLPHSRCSRSPSLLVKTSRRLTMFLLPLLFALLLPPIQTSLASASPPSLPSTLTPRQPPPSAPLQTRSNQHNKFLPLVFTTCHCLIPGAVAASHLEGLYWTLQFNAMFHWRDLPPMPQFVIRQGVLEVGVFGAGANIEWDFVAAFAARMLIATRSGYASTFVTTWANLARTKAVSISLQVRQ